MEIKIRSIFLSILIIVLFISQSAIAVEFGSNSYKITNPFIPLELGTWAFSQGSGTTWENRIFYIHAIGTEVVSGAKIGAQTFNNVKCTNAHVIITDDGGSYEHEFFTMSFAQDTEGNVWVLKVYSHQANITGLLGGLYFKSMFMPATPAKGLPAAIKMPEDDDNHCKITQIDISSITTSFDTYSDCIQVTCYDEDAADYQYEYYCRDVGNVRTIIVNTPGEFMDLKETGTSSLPKKAVVIPLM